MFWAYHCFFKGLIFLSTLTGVDSLNTIPLSCISMNNQKCRIRPQIVNINIFPLA